MADEEQLGFGFASEPVTYRTTPDPDEVREDALALIEEARAVGADAPWDAAKLKYNRMVFPLLVSWLPDDEAAQMCFAFEAEAARIEMLLAA